MVCAALAFSNNIFYSKFTINGQPKGVYYRVSGDYDGDGLLDLAVWNPKNGVWVVLLTSTPSAPLVQQWGQPGDVPLSGDYDGDGPIDFAVWRPSNGNWYVIESSTGNPVVQTWGAVNDIPVPGNYDTDLKTDFAVWRPAEGNWYVIPSSTAIRN